LSVLPPFTHLVDAAIPEPWSRSAMARQAAAAVGSDSAAASTRRELRLRFRSWLPLGDQVAALTDSIPLAVEGVTAARALADLAKLGTTALDYLDQGTAPPGWKASATTTLEALNKPQGLLRLAGIDAVKVLIEGVK
jgi:hypothetical protein